MRYHATVNGNVPFTLDEELEWDLLEADAQLQSVNKIKQEIVSKTQQRLDTWASTKNYDGILSASTYATSTIPQFKSDGQDAVNFRDLTWSTLYTILSQVEAETLPMPSGFSDIEPLLPVLTWTIQ